MNLFKAKNKADPTEQGSMTLQQLVDMLNIGGVERDKLSEATYFACLKILSESIGKLPLKLLRYDKNGGVIKAVEHPYYRILGSAPNPYMTATHFWGTVEYNRNHYGNAYVWIQNAGSGMTLWILPPDMVQVWVDDGGIWGVKNALWYLYLVKGARYKIPYDSMLHFKTSASFDGVRGLPVRDILSDTIDGSLKSQRLMGKLYENGFTAKAVLQYTGNLNEENRKAYAKGTEDYATGKVEGVKSIIPLPFGTTLQPLNVNLADNQFVDLKKYTALQISAAFGIKPNQINDYEKASYASAEAQQLAFYVDTLLYILKQYEEELDKKLLTADEIRQGYYFKFNVSVILRADLKSQTESLKNGVQGSLYTPNEARAKLDLPSVEGGDTLICNGNMMPVAMAGRQFVKGGDGNG